MFQQGTDTVFLRWCRQGSSAQQDKSQALQPLRRRSHQLDKSYRWLALQRPGTCQRHKALARGLQRGKRGLSGRLVGQGWTTPSGNNNPPNRTRKV